MNGRGAGYRAGVVGRQNVCPTGRARFWVGGQDYSSASEMPPTGPFAREAALVYRMLVGRVVGFRWVVGYYLVEPWLVNFSNDLEHFAL